MAGMVPPGGVAPSTGSSLKTVDRIRNVFPETWLWTNASVGFVILIQRSFRLLAHQCVGC